MPANAKRPNLVLIMTDEMRGDCLGAAGHPDVKTPFLDTLAAQGIRFSRAYSTCPSCIAARAALHTGLSQEHHGRVGYRDGVPWDYPVTMAGELAKAGYATACAGKMHVYPLRRSMGFHHIDLHDGYLHAHRKPNIPHHEHQMVADDYLYWLKNEKGIACDITDTGLECNSWVTRPWMYDEHLHPTNWATGRALDFLRRRDRDQPFFLMLSYVRPHAPYDPPACYYDMYKNKVLAPPFSGDWDDLERLRREGRVFCNTTGPLDPELIRQQQEILARNGENQRKRNRLNEITMSKHRIFDDIGRLDEQIQTLQKQKSQLTQEYEQAIRDEEAAMKTAVELQDESTEELERNIADIDEINRKVRANLDKDKAEEDAKEYQEQYSRLTGEIEKIRQEKTQLLDAAELPLPELSVREGELIYKGQKWDNMSGSDRLKVSAAIVRKLNPKCGFVLLDKLEQMDLDTLREFGKWLEAEGLQAIATRVSTGNECSIIIEDGYVSGQGKPEEPKKEWKAGVF